MMIIRIWMQSMVLKTIRNLPRAFIVIWDFGEKSASGTDRGWFVIRGCDTYETILGYRIGWPLMVA